MTVNDSSRRGTALPLYDLSERYFGHDLPFGKVKPIVDPYLFDISYISYPTFHPERPLEAYQKQGTPLQSMCKCSSTLCCPQQSLPKGKHFGSDGTQGNSEECGAEASDGPFFLL